MEKSSIVSLIKGHGIGLEITEAVKQIFNAASVPIIFEDVLFNIDTENDNDFVIPKESWDAMIKNGVLLKGPTTTPIGRGRDSVNVLLRKKLGLFANVRPVKSYKSLDRYGEEQIDIVVIRENEEDIYTGIEYRMTKNTSVALKTISTTASARIIFYAFEYARAHGRKKVTCVTKANIMKITDGAFLNAFNQISAMYSDIQSDSMLVDIGAAKIGSSPWKFDVVVTENLYGDILSDIASEVAGSVAIAGSSNIGLSCAMFEAVHGSAPDIAKMDIANPSGMINASILMLKHMGLYDYATIIENAMLKTIEEDMIHTKDIYKDGKSKKLVGTKDFTQAIISNLEKESHYMQYTSDGASTSRDETLKTISIKEISEKVEKYFGDALKDRHPPEDVCGYDIFIRSANLNDSYDLNQLSSRIDSLSSSMIAEIGIPMSTARPQLKSIFHKGLMIWPNGVNTDVSEDDFLQLRFYFKKNEEDGRNVAEIFKGLGELMSLLTLNNIDIVAFSVLNQFGKEQGFSFS